MEREMTYDDVLMFIVKNKDNVEIMDDLNRTVYPFTSRYKNRVEQKEKHRWYFFGDNSDDTVNIEDLSPNKQ